MHQNAGVFHFRISEKITGPALHQLFGASVPCGFKFRKITVRFNQHPTFSAGIFIKGYLKLEGHPIPLVRRGRRSLGLGCRPDAEVVHFIRDQILDFSRGRIETAVEGRFIDVDGINFISCDTGE